MNRVLPMKMATPFAAGGSPGSGLRDAGFRDSGLRDFGSRDFGPRDFRRRESGFHDSGRQDSGAFFGDALGGAVLVLSLAVVVLPIFAAGYLDRYRHSDMTPAPFAPESAALALPALPLEMPAKAAAPLPAPAPPAVASTASLSPAGPGVAAGVTSVAVPPPVPAEARETAAAAVAKAAPPAQVEPPPKPAVPPTLTVAFPSGSARLANDRRELGGIVALYRKHHGMIRIVGHGESTGARSGSDQLSSFGLAIERAKAVAVALSELGVSAADLRVEAAPPQAAGVGAEIFVSRP